MSHLKASEGARRSASAVRVQVEIWVQRYPDRAGFLTLTYLPSHATANLDSMQANWNRFLSNHARTWDLVFGPGVLVWERHKSGMVHWHGCVVCNEDIRTGTDLALVRESGGRRGASDALRRAWAVLRGWSDYGIGRNSLEPVHGDGEACGAYIAKYLVKDVGEYSDSDKGRRRVRWIRTAGFRSVWPGFGAVSRRGRWWRACVRAAVVAADDIGRESGLDGETWLRASFGPRWAWLLREWSESAALSQAPTAGNETEHALATGRRLLCPPHWRGEDWDWVGCESEPEGGALVASPATGTGEAEWRMFGGRRVRGRMSRGALVAQLAAAADWYGRLGRSVLPPGDRD